VKKYSTLIFDAFDTVVHINLSRLPACQVHGTEIRTTAPAVHVEFERRFGHLPFEVFFDAFTKSHKEVSETRRNGLREVQNPERFRMMLRHLGMKAEGVGYETLEALSRAHMNELQKTFEVRQETFEFLEWAASRFRRAMISNFDYSPALYSSLENFGIRSVFEKITVSADIGWRKPHPVLFEKTLEDMGVKASDALFIGDQLYVDVHGALNAGMDVVWIETESQDWIPAVRPEPSYTVKSIIELIDLLEKTS
jgi:HAD superfamily hydrolase (TIGR01549 family)